MTFKGPAKTVMTVNQSQPWINWALTGPLRTGPFVDRCGVGDGFFLACVDLGRVFDDSVPACGFFFFLRPGSVHSGSAS